MIRLREVPTQNRVILGKHVDIHASTSHVLFERQASLIYFENCNLVIHQIMVEHHDPTTSQPRQFLNFDRFLKFGGLCEGP
jgi:hypothetical protein